MTDMFTLDGLRVWVAGHNGMVGSAICRRLEAEHCDVVTVSRADVDLRRQAETEAWMAAERPDAVFLAAAKVGGIHANDTHPADFIYDNLAIETNIIHAARAVGVRKLLFLGSSCIYPRLAPQPMAEDALLAGPLEPTNQSYAIAKIAGIEMCRAYRQQFGCDFISAMPTNLYGPKDNFDLELSHVVPALMVKAHNAKLSAGLDMTVWGSGKPRRELLFVDDLADALVHLMKVYSDAPHVNIGTGQDVTLDELARLICDVVGYRGALRYDGSKPDLQGLHVERRRNAVEVSLSLLLELLERSHTDDVPPLLEAEPLALQDQRKSRVERHVAQPQRDVPAHGAAGDDVDVTLIAEQPQNVLDVSVDHVDRDAEAPRQLGRTQPVLAATNGVRQPLGSPNRRSGRRLLLRVVPLEASLVGIGVGICVDFGYLGRHGAELPGGDGAIAAEDLTGRLGELGH